MSVSESPTPSLSEATAVWWKIGVLSFGGPAAQIALMHHFIVEERRWLTEQQYLNALSFCMLLPGPEAMQLATYSGWRMHGVKGGLVAGLLFVLPGALIILCLALLYAYLGNVPALEAIFLGVKAAVIVIVIQALLKVAGKALTSHLHRATALLAFIGIFAFNVPFPIIVLAAGLCGWMMSINGRLGQRSVENDNPFHALTIRSTCVTVIVWLAIWFSPLALLWAVGADQFLLQIGRFFSTLAVVTFGGAYAVLAYLAQDVVSQYGWLSTGEMMDGLGLAETTPGPLILVTEFVAFLAGFKQSGLAMGLLAAGLTLWVTFVPCFLWIFAGAPYLSWLVEQPRLNGALSLITAAVVGVILNLSVWFTLHVMFGETEQQNVGVVSLLVPVWETVNWKALLLTALSALLLYGFKLRIVTMLLVVAVSGLLMSVPELVG